MNIAGEQTSKVEMVKFLEELQNSCAYSSYNVEPITTVISLLKADIKKGRYKYCSIGGVMFSVYIRAIEANL